MRILAGAVCRQTPEVLHAHLETMLWQRGDFELDFMWIDDNDDPLSTKLLRDATAFVFPAAEKPAEAAYAVEEETHRWAVPTFHWLAKEKQRILNHAMKEGYDAVWLVDTDLLCAPTTLSSLVACDRPVVSAVFWTAWEAGAVPMPQVWREHPYGFDGIGEDGPTFLRRLANRELVRVAGLGANTLIRREALERGLGYWPLLEGLPEWGMWQGEDRHFSVRAQKLHIDLWADAWPHVRHCYRPSDREALGTILDEMREPRRAVQRGDAVNFTLEPLEEPGLVGYKTHVRGVLGQIDVLPEVEEALEGMLPGDSKIIRCPFPSWWGYAPYRGASRTLRIRLIDCEAA